MPKKNPALTVAAFEELRKSVYQASDLTSFLVKFLSMDDILVVHSHGTGEDECCTTEVTGALGAIHGALARAVTILSAREWQPTPKSGAR